MSCVLDSNRASQLQKAFILTQIFENNISREETVQALSALDFPSKGKLYHVALLRPITLPMPGASGRFDMLVKLSDAIEMELKQTLAPNIMSLCCMLEHGTFILTASDTSRTMQPYTDEAEYLRNIASNVSGQIAGTPPISVLISPPVPNIGQIHEAYAMTCELFAAAVTYSLDVELLRYEDLCRAGNTIFTAEYMKGLQHREIKYWLALSANDFREAQRILHEIVQYDLRLEQLNVQCMSAVFYSLLNKLRCAIDGMRLLAGRSAFEAFETAPQILYSQSLMQVDLQIDVIFDTFYHDESRSTAPPPWLSRLQQYIHENYCDSNLNVATAANHFNLNAAYAARIYKKQDGISILDDINMLRLEEAKKLIAQHHSLTEVASITGYDNLQRMNRAFKKYFGVAPKTYMMSSNNQNDSD